MKRNAAARDGARVAGGAKVRAALVLGSIVGNPVTEQRSGCIATGSTRAITMDNLPAVVVALPCTCCDGIRRSDDNVAAALADMITAENRALYRRLAAQLARS